jgi:hypothetical protein
VCPTTTPALNNTCPLDTPPTTTSVGPATTGLATGACPATSGRPNAGGLVCRQFCTIGRTCNTTDPTATNAQCLSI